MRPQISVITTAYNAEPFIGETIESILGQTMGDLEFVVVDDGSTDGTADVVESFRDSRLSLVRVKHGGLPAIGRNVAVSHSSAPVIAITDADDISLPTRLEKQIAFLKKHTETSLVHTHSYDLLNDEERIAERQCPVEGVMGPEEAIVSLLRRNFVRTSSVAIRRKLFEAAGGFDEDRRLCGVEDFALWLQCFEQRASFGYIDEPLIKYRIHAGSLSSDTVVNSTNTLWAMEKAVRRRPELYAPLRSLIQRRQSKSFVKRGISRIRGGKNGARADFWSGLKTNPYSLLAWKWLAISMLGNRMAGPLLAWRETKDRPLPVRLSASTQSFSASSKGR